MRRIFIALAALLLIVLPALVAAQNTSPPPAAPEVTETPIPVEFFVTDVLNTYPHDPGSFTQGLLLYENTLYESAGENNESDIRQVDLESGEVLRKVELLPTDFAEGLALVDDRLIQLTWTQQIAFVYDLETFEPQGTLSYTGQGWGLCYDEEVLWRSDGTEILTAHDPETFEGVSELPVTFQGYALSQIGTPSGFPLSRLNELECVDESIYANVWYTDYILRIDAATGQVTGIIDASNLLTVEERMALLNADSSSVLNGIAYNPETETFLLTGKYWPKLFEVQFTPMAMTGG